MNVQLKKRGFYLKVYAQDMNPEASGTGFPAQFFISSPKELLDTFYARFLDGDLGKIYMAVLWDGLVTALGL